MGSHTHTKTFFQTIYNNPPKGEETIIQGTYTQGFSKTPSIPAMKIVISSTYFMFCKRDSIKYAALMLCGTALEGKVSSMEQRLRCKK